MHKDTLSPTKSKPVVELTKKAWKAKYSALQEDFSYLLTQFNASESIRQDQALMIENLKAQIVKYRQQLEPIPSRKSSAEKVTKKKRTRKSCHL